MWSTQVNTGDDDGMSIPLGGGVYADLSKSEQLENVFAQLEDVYEEEDDGTDMTFF